MGRCDVCSRRRILPLGTTCRRCVTWSWRVLAGLSAAVLLSLWGCGGLAVAQPLEVKLIGQAECTDGWVQVGEVERGVTVFYPMANGSFFGNWITWERFIGHFRGSEPVGLDGVRQETRITCRWSPMGGAPA